MSATFASNVPLVASATAFLLSELDDLGVYTPLQRRGLILAVVAGSAVGLVVDSVVFLYLAFGDLTFLAGQVIGKSWMVLIAIPLILRLCARDERIGLALSQRAEPMNARGGAVLVAAPTIVDPPHASRSAPRRPSTIPGRA